jgi:hypothetical protein
VRVCDEHRCIILRNSDIWGLFNRGQLRLKRPYTKVRKDPTPDRRSRIAPWNQDISLVNDTYPPKHSRHIVLEAHCFRYADGNVGGATGLIDPKEVLIGNILYVRLEYADPHCSLCESGDMIPNEMRFFNSRYKPQTTPLARWRRVQLELLKQYNILRDRWVQRYFVRLTMPPSGLT